jgi:hypothetical protein
MTKTTLKTTNERIDNLEKKMDMILDLLQNGKQTNGNTKGSANSTKVEREAKREAEKTEFKANHKLIKSSKENKQLVYDEMKKQGINEFNRKDYERIAKGLGVLGKSGKVVATWEAK